MSNTQDWSHDPEPHASFHIYHATNPTKKAIAEEPDTKPSTDGFQAECLNSDQRGQAGAPASINDSEKYHGRSGFPQKCSVSTAGTGAESKPFLTLTPKSGNFPGSLKQRFSFRPRRPSFRSTVKAINDWWLVELAACMVSFSAMLALVLVIRHYDGKPLPKWPLRITIGTYIAVCSKIMSAMLLVPVIQSMSQYKCYMYRRTRTSLDTMGLVDNATRGVAGSLYLLLSKRWSIFASFGALITILAVAVDPCFQEAVHTPQSKVVLNSPDRPIIPRIQSYTHPWPIQPDLSLGPYRFDDLNTAERPVKAAVYDGLFGNTRKMTASCSTGDCQWQNFMSLAVCNRCQDVTSLIDSQHSLPNGLHLTDTALANSSTSMSLSEVGHTPWTLLNLAILGREVAYECSLFWCVKEYNTSMVNGTVIERTEATWSNDSLTNDHNGVNGLSAACKYEMQWGGQDEGELTVQNGPCSGGIGCCFINFYVNGSLSPNMNFSVDYMTHSTLHSFLGRTLQGNITLAHRTSPVYNPEEMQALLTSPDSLQARSNLSTIEKQIRNMTLVNIPSLMNNITDSISVRMRQAVIPEDPNFSPNGEAYHMLPVIEFRYLWLLYPGFLLLSTFAFLVAMMWMNHRSDAPLWKSNPNAMLFSGLAEDHYNKGAAHARLSELDGMAEMAQAKLEKVDQRWRLV